MKKHTRIDLRIEQEMLDELVKLPNYSEYIRRLIIDDMIKQGSPYVEKRKKELKKELASLDSINK